MFVTGTGIDYNLHCKLECGSYAQTHEDHNNNMTPRTNGESALRPTGNIQGGFYFYNLATGCIISHRHWTSLPMPIKVINVVHDLVKRDKASTGINYNVRTLDLINVEQTADQADMSDNIESNEAESSRVDAGMDGNPNNTIVDAEISGVDAEIAEVDSAGEVADYMLENRENML